MAEHPEIGRAVRAGDICIEHIRVITDAKTVLPDGVLAETAGGLVEAAKVNHPGPANYAPCWACPLARCQ